MFIVTTINATNININTFFNSKSSINIRHLDYTVIGWMLSIPWTMRVEDGWQSFSVCSASVSGVIFIFRGWALSSPFFPVYKIDTKLPVSIKSNISKHFIRAIIFPLLFYDWCFSFVVWKYHINIFAIHIRNEGIWENVLCFKTLVFQTC